MKQLAVLCSLCLLSFLAGAQRISIQPSTLDFRLGPGATQSQNVTIGNYSDKRIAFQAYLNDWLRDSTGAHIYLRPDTLKRSCASWVQLGKTFIELGPGESMELAVQLQGPADSAAYRQMKWAMLFVQTVDEQDSATRRQKQLQTTIRETMRVGIHIYQTPPSLSLKKAKALTLRPIPEDSTACELRLRNTGEVMLYCKAYLSMTDVATGKEFKSEPVDFPVFPDGLRKVKLKLPEGVPDGTYSALGIVDLGEDKALEGVERTISVKSGRITVSGAAR